MLGGTVAIVAGLLSFLAGIAAILNASFYPTVANYTYRATTVHTWGWVLMALGVLLFAAGVSNLLGIGWARGVGIGLAALLAIASFMFLPYAPLFGIVLVALSVFVIWGLLNPDVDSGAEANRAEMGPMESSTNKSDSMRV